jgi:hypothetical protein
MIRNSVCIYNVGIDIILHNRKNLMHNFFVGIVVALTIACVTVTAQHRIFSIGLDEGPNNDFNAALQKALDAGMTGTQLFMNWSDLEPDSGQYDFENTYLWAAQWYGARDLKVIFYINPINTNQKEVPADLMNVDFDDPRMISRFKTLLDTVVTYLGDETIYFAMGNEINGYLHDSTSFEEYAKFFNEVSGHVKTLKPGIKTGYAVMLDAQFHLHQPYMAETADSADVMIGTYYGTSGDSVIDPVEIESLIDTFVTLSGDKPLIISELGYPCSPVLRSSDSMQADFITHAFIAWEKHKNKIPFIHFMKMWEWTSAQVQVFTQYYGLDNPEFVAFLSSIGLHDTLGNPKPAWDRLVQESRKYGFLRIETLWSNQRPGLSVRCWPNPFSTSVYFEIRTANSELRDLELAIYDIRGKLVHQFSNRSSHSAFRNSVYAWDARNQPNGIYIINVKTGKRRFIKKLILQK